MEHAERLAFLSFTEELANNLRQLVLDRAAMLATTDTEMVEAIWQVWDAIIDEERRQRAEWVRSELEDDRINAEARAAHPDDYDEWLDAENANLREMIVRRLEERRGNQDPE